MVSISKTSDIILYIARLRNEDTLTLSHFAVLAYLYKSARFCSSFDIASACGLHIRQLQLTNDSSVIGVLIKKGLVSVIENKGTIKNHYSLTVLGRQVLENECLSVRDYLNDLLF